MEFMLRTRLAGIILASVPKITRITKEIIAILKLTSGFLKPSKSKSETSDITPTIEFPLSL